MTLIGSPPRSNNCSNFSLRNRQPPIATTKENSFGNVNSEARTTVTPEISRALELSSNTKFGVSPASTAAAITHSACPPAPKIMNDFTSSSPNATHRPFRLHKSFLADVMSILFQPYNLLQPLRNRLIIRPGPQ